MSEHEESLQIGRLAEDYERLKGEVRHVEERVERAQRAYQVAAISFRDIAVQDDQLTIAASADDNNSSAAHHLQHLLSSRELIELFHQRAHLRSELDHVRDKLRTWLNYV